MGKGVFFLIGAAMLGASALMFGAKQSTFDAQKEQAEYEYTVLARDIAESGYEEALSAIRRELENVDQTKASVDMLGGAYSKDIDENFYGNMEVKVEGRYADTLHSIASSVIFSTPFPGAVALSDDEIDAGVYGDSKIEGHDWRADGSTGQFLQPVSAVVTDGTHESILEGALPAARVKGQGNLDGQNGTPSVDGTFDEAFYEALYQEVITTNEWDYSINMAQPGATSQLFSAASNSSAANPRIVRVQGDVYLSQPLTGHGLLIVENGDFVVTGGGDLNWQGLVMLRKTPSDVGGKDTVRVQLRNDATIYGGLVGYSIGSTGGGGGGSEEDCAADFVIDGNETIVQDSFRVKITVLGAAISMGGQYNMPVTTRIVIGGQVYEPFGDWDYAASSNVNTGNSGTVHTWEPETVFPPNTGIKIHGRSWEKKKSWYSGNSNSHWKVFMSKHTDAVDDQLAALKDGDSVPNVGGYLGQYSVEDFVDDYIDEENDEMTLDAGQSIYLFELGSDQPWSAAHDMQDLVVLVTMTNASNSTSGGSCQPGVVAASRIEYQMFDDAGVYYSPEAIARLGQRLSSIRQDTRVVVVSDEATTTGVN